jgi:hypothetical protein
MPPPGQCCRCSKACTPGWLISIPCQLAGRERYRQQTDGTQFPPTYGMLLTVPRSEPLGSSNSAYSDVSQTGTPSQAPTSSCGRYSLFDEQEPRPASPSSWMADRTAPSEGNHSNSPTKSAKPYRLWQGKIPKKDWVQKPRAPRALRPKPLYETFYQDRPPGMKAARPYLGRWRRYPMSPLSLARNVLNY